MAEYRRQPSLNVLGGRPLALPLRRRLASLLFAWVTATDEGRGTFDGRGVAAAVTAAEVSANLPPVPARVSEFLRAHPGRAANTGPSGNTPLLLPDSEIGGGGAGDDDECYLHKGLTPELAELALDDMAALAEDNLAFDEAARDAAVESAGLAGLGGGASAITTATSGDDLHHHHNLEDIASFRGLSQPFARHGPGGAKALPSLRSIEEECVSLVQGDVMRRLGETLSDVCSNYAVGSAIEERACSFSSVALLAPMALLCFLGSAID